MIKKLVETLWKYKLEAFLLTVGIVLTVLSRDYAVTRRLAMGLEPSFGGEFLILPIMALAYSVTKSDWSVE